MTAHDLEGQMPRTCTLRNRQRMEETGGLKPKTLFNSLEEQSFKRLLKIPWTASFQMSNKCLSNARFKHH